jgi:hypothetical protein
MNGWKKKRKKKLERARMNGWKKRKEKNEWREEEN